MLPSYSSEKKREEFVVFVPSDVQGIALQSQRSNRLNLALFASTNWEKPTPYFVEIVVYIYVGTQKFAFLHAYICREHVVYSYSADVS